MTPTEAELAERAVALHRDGWAVQDITRELSASRRTVIGWLEAAGVEVTLSERTWNFGWGRPRGGR